MKKGVSLTKMTNLAIGVGIGLLLLGIFVPIGMDLLNTSKWFNAGTTATVVQNLPVVIIAAVLIGVVGYFATKK